ncbi:MAG: hypothetical protein M1453_09375 [Acidobacteria bacterium]|nr:hypothetical protein [Acidobacteriota bacterium]
MLQLDRFMFHRPQKALIASTLALLLAARVVLPSDTPLLVVIDETGQSRDGVPVLRLHAAGGGTRDALLRGFSARWLRLFRLEQIYLHKKCGRAPGRPHRECFLLG